MEIPTQAPINNDTAQFYKLAEGKWKWAKKIEFPNGVTLSEANKIEFDGWKWYETPPFEYQSIAEGNLELKKDKDFGIYVYDTFISDNRALPVTFTPAMMEEQDLKFSAIEKWLKRGVISYSLLLLSQLETDSIMTQARKDKYMGMCSNYLSNNP